MSSDPFASEIAGRIFGYIFIHLLKTPTGHLTEGQGGYMVSGERYAPAVAYIFPN